MEEVIQIETAFLAEEKGIKLELYKSEWFYFDEHGDKFVSTVKPKRDDAKQVVICKQSELQKYLREEHNIIVVADYDVNKRKYFHWLIIHGETREQSSFYDRWEQALELGLVRGLKQIK